MFRMLSHLFGLFVRSLRSREVLLFENLALRQQLTVLRLKRRQPKLHALDRLFWILLRRFWPGWKNALILVQPETVVGWHRAGFKMYWRWLSRHRASSGRRCVRRELRELIFRMVAENRTWGAPRVHGELKMLGFDISERSVLRWMRRAPRSPEPANQWKVFLSNHRDAIAAMDFFTVPTLTFGMLYGFFIISHNKRRILPAAQSSPMCSPFEPSVPAENFRSCPHQRPNQVHFDDDLILARHNSVGAGDGAAVWVRNAGNLIHGIVCCIDLVTRSINLVNDTSKPVIAFA